MGIFWGERTSLRQNAWEKDIPSFPAAGPGLLNSLEPSTEVRWRKSLSLAFQSQHLKNNIAVTLGASETGIAFQRN